MQKSVYVCGPLTELSPEEAVRARWFYERIADCAESVLGIRGFVPHEHYDPVKHANFTPQQVDAAEREQVCTRTSCLVAVALAPSWGGGIEVEMANQSGVPVILLCERKKLQARKISRLFRGNPAVQTIIEYDTEDEALANLTFAFAAAQIHA